MAISVDMECALAHNTQRNIQIDIKKYTYRRKPAAAKTDGLSTYVNVWKTFRIE